MTRRADTTLTFLGDLVRTVHQLQPPDDALPLIARMLHLETAPVSPVKPRAQRRQEQPQPETPVPPRETGPAAREPSEEIAPVLPPARPKPEDRLHVVPISIEAVHDEEQEEALVTLAPPARMAAATDEEEEPDPELLPLLDPMTLRSAVVSAVETRSLETVPDVDALTAALIRGEAIREIPFRRSPTVRRGAQVLVDRGPGMVPFVRDADQLAAAISSLVNASSTSVLRFRGMPGWGVYDLHGARRRYEYPPPGVPVVIISDFGISSEALPDVRPVLSEWLQLVRELRARGSSVVAFIPYERERWPRELAGSVVLVNWDRGATSMKIRTARERLER